MKTNTTTIKINQLKKGDQFKNLYMSSEIIVITKVWNYKDKGRSMTEYEYQLTDGKRWYFNGKSNLPITILTTKQ